MSEENLPPTIEERYMTATNTSTLKMELDRPNVADVLVAAGWNRARFGMALMRLQSEWDSTAKPRRLSKAAEGVLAKTFLRGGPLVLTDQGLRARGMRDHFHCDAVGRENAARRQADEWFKQELGLQLLRLKTLPEARDMLAEFGIMQNIQHAHGKAASAIAWWLDHTCPVCGGGRYQLMPGTNRHSNRLCGECEGRGEVVIPHGYDGRRLVGEIESSMNEGRCGLGSEAPRVRDRKRWVLEQQEASKTSQRR
ncbi:hypothetical protein LJR084_001904 [Variovorax sp. LjRoot84]|uniref:hypothetical protein n=1 Tax=Variovorax sp. LjRoot84 TaxID=3342340 RepID=UPI003ECF5BDE